jgi:serine protease AprX
MRGIYVSDWGIAIKRACAGVAVAAIFTQTLAMSAGAQTVKGFKADIQMDVPVATKADAQPMVDQTPDAKLSPDMLEAVEGHSARSGSDPMTRVIIQVKPATDLNQLSGEVPAKRAIEMIAVEAKEVKMKAAGLRDTLSTMRGAVKKAFNNIGMVSAELPLSKVKELAASADVAYISPDRDVESFGHVMQTLGMYNSGVYVKSGTDYRDATGIGIAIIDSGMFSGHELFKKGGVGSRVVANVDFTGQGRTDDPYGHGTHVASLAAGDWALNGGAEEAPASEANIINLRALNSDGAGTSSTVIAALDWAIANKTAYNIKVINMSLGVMAKDSYKNDPLCLAARRAFNAGIVVVASAGNAGKNANGSKVYGSVNSPGIEPTVLTVGAVDSKATDYRSDDGIATYSSRGPGRGYQVVAGVKKYDNNMKPDVVAPGNKLLGARAPLNKLLSLNAALGLVGSLLTPDNKKLMYLSGTSMSAPVVSGAAAVLLDTNPALTPNMVKAILMYTAQNLNGYNTLEQGAGEINLDGAVRVAKLVKTTLPTANGTALLNSALPSPQRSTIGNQNAWWSKSIVTNRLLLTGDDLMNKYQGMYANGVYMGDSVSVVNARLTRSATMTSGVLGLAVGGINGDTGVVMGDGVIMADGVIRGGDGTGVVMGDSVIFLHGTPGGDGGVVMGDGVYMGDSIVMGDGVCMGDGVYMGDSWALSALNGDETGAMPDAVEVAQR